MPDIFDQAAKPGAVPLAAPQTKGDIFDQAAAPTSKIPAKPLSPFAMIGEGEELGAQGNAAMANRYVEAGPKEIGAGAKEVGAGDVAHGVHRMFKGAGITALPAAPVAVPLSFAAAPLATGLGIAGGAAAQPIGKYGGEAVGLTPDQADVAGDLLGLAGSYGASKAAGPLASFFKRFSVNVRPTWRFGPLEVGYQSPESSASEAYEQKAQDLMRRGREQAALDRQAARSAPPASPLSGMPSSAPSDVLALPERAAPLAPTGKPAASPVTSSGANAKFVREIPKPITEPNRIQLPGSEGPGYKVTYQSYGADQLVEMAKKGDVQAVRELMRNPRGVDLSQIPNLRYLLEAEAKRVPWRNFAK